MIEVLGQHGLRQVYDLPSLNISNESFIELKIRETLHLVSDSQVNQAEGYPRSKSITFSFNCFV